MFFSEKSICSMYESIVKCPCCVNLTKKTFSLTLKKYGLCKILGGALSSV